MNPYLGIPLSAAIACVAFGSVILLMGVRQQPNRVAAALMMSAGFWAACEVLWNSASDPRVALWLQRASAPGWVFVGALAFHLATALTATERRRRLGAFLYGIGGLFLLLTWTTPWMVERMQPTAWGFGAVPGPLFPLWLVYIGVSSGLSLRVMLRDPALAHVRDRRHSPVLVPMALLFATAFLTDLTLPLLGLQLPRFGSLVIAVLGARVLWHLDHFGYSRLSPTGFASRVLRTLPDGIALVNLNGRIRLANERMANLIGCSISRAEGVAIANHLDPALLDPPRELREAASELRPIAGRTIPVSISAAPLMDNASHVMGMVVIARDMREVSLLRDRLVTSDRLIAVGQLAAGIAHEVNNPLAFVRSNLGFMRREWRNVVREIRSRDESEAAGEWEELIAETLDGVDRAAGIIRDVKSISHTGRGERASADLNALLEQVLRVAAPQFKSRIRIETSYGRIPDVPCSPQRLQQLFLNLVVNAAQAIEGTGVVRITTERSGDSVIATVEDDGRGIPPDAIERIFDPFFTTKGVGEGSGLGLSISYEIVRSHRGEIWVDSEPGRGTAFCVRLPLDVEAEPGT